MATTRYSVTGTDKTFTKKAAAVEAALEIRNDQRVDVQVATEAGKVVFEAKAPKKIKMSAPYTRVVELPADFVVPDGFRVCYARPRRGLAVLHNFDEDYRLFDLKTQTILPEVYPTTREAGKAMLAHA